MVFHKTPYLSFRRLVVRNVPSWILLFLLLLPIATLFSADTAKCTWHAAYFDVVYMNWYGTGVAEEERYLRDVITRSNVIIRLDSLLKTLNHQGRLKSFKRWTLIDNPHASYQHFGDSKPGDLHIEDSKAYFCFADSVAVNRLLKELWNIEGINISPSRQCGMWLYSLHLGVCKDRAQAQQFPDTLWIFERPDFNLVWLSIERNSWVRHAFYQHETDGYYHQYTGLYLTRKNVLEAQRLLLEHRNLKTTIVSQYITSAIIKKYAFQ